MLLTLLATGLVSVTAGGIRLKAAKDAFDLAKTEDERIQKEAADLKASLDVVLSRIGKRILSSRKLLRKAQHILAANEIYARFPDQSLSGSGHVLLGKAQVAIREHELMLGSFAAIAVGPAIAAGAWASVAMLGIASTGTAIGTLHGVALSNATLAWFGGGSVASGGGGMIAGKILLAKICIVPAALYFTYKSFSKASEYDEATAEITKCNEANSSTLQVMEERYRKLGPLDGLLEQEEEDLRLAIELAARALFRFGSVSRVWRRLRVLFGHSYYAEKELSTLQALEDAVLRFFATFNPQPSKPNP